MMGNPAGCIYTPAGAWVPTPKGGGLMKKRKPPVTARRIGRALAIVLALECALIAVVGLLPV